MVASILKIGNKQAVQVYIKIVRAFVDLRQFASEFTELNQKLKTFVLDTNIQFSEIYRALTEELAGKEEEQKQLDKRRRIGFKTMD